MEMFFLQNVTHRGYFQKVRLFGYEWTIMNQIYSISLMLKTVNCFNCKHEMCS